MAAENHPTVLRYDIPGAVLVIVPDFLETFVADAYLAECEKLPFSQGQVTVFGKRHNEPRLTYFCADTPAANYTYSGKQLALSPPPMMPSAVMELRDLVAAFMANYGALLGCTAAVPHNACLVNLYRNGGDCIGMHSDAEQGLVPGASIASISLGAERSLKVTRRPTSTVGWPAPFSVSMPHGSLLIMAGDMQQNYLHGIGRSAKVKEKRINLTFRSIVVKDTPPQV